MKGGRVLKIFTIPKYFFSQLANKNVSLMLRCLPINFRNELVIVLTSESNTIYQSGKRSLMSNFQDVSYSFSVGRGNNQFGTVFPKEAKNRNKIFLQVQTYFC